MTESQEAVRMGDRRAWMRLIGAGIWLVYLNTVVAAIWEESGWSRALGLVAVAAFCLVYLAGMFTVSVFRDSQRKRHLLISWIYVGLLIILAAVTVPSAGDTCLAFTVFIAVAAVASMPLKQAFSVAVTLVLLCEMTAQTVPDWSDHGNGFSVALASLAVGFIRSTILRTRELRAAQEELAETAVAEERSRIATDLHDILGHSLTVITVKAELAEKLMNTEPARARDELSQLQELSRSALHDVRQTTLGVRGISLAGELAAARQALDSAGIEADIPSAADQVPQQLRELFAWTVREAVTNVVRHSNAQHCRIEFSDTWLSVTDDGIGLGAPASGHGLGGMRQRADTAGAVLTLGAGIDGSGTEIRLDSGDAAAESSTGSAESSPVTQETHG